MLQRCLVLDRHLQLELLSSRISQMRSRKNYFEMILHTTISILEDVRRRYSKHVILQIFQSQTQLTLINAWQWGELQLKDLQEEKVFCLYRKTFLDSVKACKGKTGDDACTCWKNTTLSESFTELKKCDFSVSLRDSHGLNSFKSFLHPERHKEDQGWVQGLQVSFWSLQEA